MLEKIRDRLINNRINVGVGDIKISESPNILATHLGSCIAIVIYDQKDKRGGMLHFLLPQNPGGSAVEEKYCDTGINKLLSYFGGIDTIKSGCDRYVFFVIGGATIISTGTIDIAFMNIEAMKAKLAEFHLKPKLIEVGGKKGYEVLFDCKEGNLYYRRFGEEYKEVYSK